MGVLVEQLIFCMACRGSVLLSPVCIRVMRMLIAWALMVVVQF